MEAHTRPGHFCWCTSWWIVSCLRKGVTSFQVLLFCCRRLNTVCKVLFFFGIHSIGIAYLAAATIHHPAVVYHSIFQASSGQNASGHLGSLCLSCFDSSIKGISWRTSWSGGSSNGSAPNRSLNNSTIFSWTWGISSSVYSLISLIPMMLGMSFWLFLGFLFLTLVHCLCHHCW